MDNLAKKIAELSDDWIILRQQMTVLQKRMERLERRMGMRVEQKQLQEAMKVIGDILEESDKQRIEDAYWDRMSCKEDWGS